MNSRSRAWCFTLHLRSENEDQPTEEEVRRYLNDVTTDGVFWSCQVERTKKGGLHLQGYVNWNDAKTFKRMAAALPSAHLEIARGTVDENIDYTGKEETRVSGPFTYTGKGWIKPGQGKRTDITDFCEQFIAKRGRLDVHDSTTGIFYARMVLLHSAGINALRREITRPPRPISQPLEVLVLWGPTGSGKTSWVFDNFLFDSIYMFPAPSNGMLWADGYDNQPVAVIDDFEDTDLTCAFMKRITDRYVIILRFALQL